MTTRGLTAHMAANRRPASMRSSEAEATEIGETDEVESASARLPVELGVRQTEEDAGTCKVNAARESSRARCSSGRNA